MNSSLEKPKLYKQDKVWAVEKIPNKTVAITAWFGGNRETNRAIGLSPEIKSRGAIYWIPKKAIRKTEKLGLPEKGVSGYGWQLVRIEFEAWVIGWLGLELKPENNLNPEIAPDGEHWS